MSPRLLRGLAGAAAALVLAAQVQAAGSVCRGRPARGSLEGGVALPGGGPNFSPYSSLAGPLGRTYVHEQVRDIVVAAYAAMAAAQPAKVFVYGETGKRSGGRIRPHRTHQNGLSVDFMVPVLDAAGVSVPLPTRLGNQFGYAIEFDAAGRFGELRIDFEAIGEHLVQLHQAALAHKAGIELVIFDPRYMPKLLATSRGPYLKQHLRFMDGPAWIRHDEHYHVDFAVACQPFVP